MARLEAETQREILAAYANHPRVVLWRQNTGAAAIGKRFVRFGLPGQADISGLIAPSGRALFIEVKSDTGKQSEVQRTFQRFVERSGAIYILARSVDDVRKAVGE